MRSICSLLTQRMFSCISCTLYCVAVHYKYMRGNFLPVRRAVRQAHFTCASGTAKSMVNAEFYKHGLWSLSKEHNPRGTMERALARLGKPQIVESPGPSSFVKPYSIMYTMDGRQRRWDAVQVWAWEKLDAEAGGRAEPPLSAAFTYELCAGIVDKNKSLEEITSEEIREETGFEVAPVALRSLTTYNSSVGTGGSVHHMFAAEVDESMRAGAGGGLEDTGEAIEVLMLPLDSVPDFVTDSSLNKSAGLLFGLMWLHAEKRRRGT